MLPRRGYSTPFIGPETVCRISPSLARTVVLKKVALLSLELLGDYEKTNCIHSQGNQVMSLQGPLPLSRDKLRKIPCCGTDHGKFCKHLTITGCSIDSSECRLCGLCGAGCRLVWSRNGRASHNGMFWTSL